MIYFIFICTVFFVIYKLNFKCATTNNGTEDVNFWFKYIFIAGLFILIIALQFEVGTDYYSYLEGATKSATGLKKLELTLADYEYLSGLVMIIVQNFFKPQMIFFFYATIQFIAYGFILKYLLTKRYQIEYILFFYFTVSIIFFNSFNAIRQCTAIPFFILSIIYILKNSKKKSYIMLAIAALFHHSALFLLPIVLYLDFFKKKPIKINIRWFLLILFFSGVLYFFDLNSIINNVLLKIPSFSNLAFRAYIEKMSILNIITRILKIIPIIYCCYKINQDNLTINEKNYLNLAYFSIIFLFLSFSSSIIWRLYGYFDFFIMFPLLFYFRKKGNRNIKILIICYFAVMLLFKIVLFPSSEYLYDSIIFK